VSEPIRLLVWTPSETIVEADDLQWVHVELSEGQGVTIWPGHAPLLAETAAEALRYADSRGEHAVDLPPGIVHVQGNTVTVFLAGTLDEEVSRREEEGRRFDRLASVMLHGPALASDG